MTDWSPGPVYTFRCGCGVKLVAADSVELERLKGEHFDSHAGVGWTSKRRGRLTRQGMDGMTRRLDRMRAELSDLFDPEDDGLEEGDNAAPCLDPRCPVLNEASKALGQTDIRASLSQLGGNPCSTSPLSVLRGSRRAHPLLGLRSSTRAEEGS